MEKFMKMQEDENGSESCSTADFDISNDEPLDSAISHSGSYVWDKCC
jgi:hypothetical protein